MPAPLIIDTAIPEIKIVETRRFGDSRGYLTETYNARDFASVGIDYEFVQDNRSVSSAPGTVRGLHFQRPEMDQAKLVHVTQGRLLDVAVDIRKGSPTYGQHVAIELSVENGRQLMIPKGFCHGFCTLEPNTTIVYKVDNFYSPDHEMGIRWNDPTLAVNWPIEEAETKISEKDAVLPFFADFDSPYTYSK